MSAEGPLATVRVLTINAWNTEGEAEHREQMNLAIAKLDPDVIAFQEIWRSPEYDQLSHLLAGTSLTGVHEFDIRGATGERRMGSALASRWPISNIEGIRASSPVQGAQLIGMAADVDLASGTSFVFMCVKPSWALNDERSRVREVMDITEVDDRRRLRAPTVIAGDFDAEPDADSMRYLAGKTVVDGRSVRYHDAWATAGHGFGPTWTSDNELAKPVIEQLVGQEHHHRRIDYVWVGARHAHPDVNARVLSCEIVLADPPLSDHFGVLATIRFEPLP